MKKFYLKSLAAVMLLAVGVFSSCSSDDDDPKPGDNLSLNKTSVSFTAAGGDESFTVTSDGTWNVTVEPVSSWLTVTPTNGTGNQTVDVKATANTGLARTATIKVKVGTNEKSVSVEQAAAIAVTTTDVSTSDIYANNANLKGSFTNVSSLTVSEVGVEWKSVGGTYAAVPATGTASPFTVNVSSLQAGTKYYFRAYVKAGSDTFYGTEKEFTTKAISSSTVWTENVGDVDITGETQVFATFNGWEKGGKAGAALTYSMDGSVSITNTATGGSGGYADASGGNNILMATGSTLTIPNIALEASERDYSISLGALITAGTWDGLTLEGSVDNAAWTKISLPAPSLSSVWGGVSGVFAVNSGATYVSLRITVDENTSVKLDDFMVKVGAEGTGGFPIGDVPGMSMLYAATPMTITTTSAIMTAQMEVEKLTVNVTEYGHEYRVKDAATWIKHPYTEKTYFVNSSGGRYLLLMNPLTGLTPGTDYQCRAYVCIDGGAPIYNDPTGGEVIMDFATLAE